MPWADRLWIVAYVAHMESSGSGTGLYYVDQSMQLHKHPSSVVGTYANRFIHGPRNELLIGPHVIDVKGNVRTIEALVPHRLAATMLHLDYPENKERQVAAEGLEQVLQTNGKRKKTQPCEAKPEALFEASSSDLENLARVLADQLGNYDTFELIKHLVSRVQ